MKIVEWIFLVLGRLSWYAIGIGLLIFFFGSWYLMWCFEGGDGVANGSNYWWYFIVTASTVGYGDFSPITTGGRIVAICIMFGGIGTLGAALGKLAESFVYITQRRKLGMNKLHLKDHVVIFGYQQGFTEEVIAELHSDGGYRDCKIVLCSHSTTQNPFGKGVEFVQGELSSDDVMERACIATASRIVIYGGTDEQTLITAIAVNDVAHEDAHIVVYFRRQENIKHLRKVSERVECLHSLASLFLVQSIVDPGSFEMHRALASNQDRDASFHIQTPETFPELSFGDLLVAFKRKFNAILIGVSASEGSNAHLDLNPSNDYLVKSGMFLTYIAAERLTISDEQWSNL